MYNCLYTLQLIKLTYLNSLCETWNNRGFSHSQMFISNHGLFVHSIIKWVNYCFIICRMINLTTNIRCYNIWQSSILQTCSDGPYVLQPSIPQICAAGTYYSRLYNTHTQLELSIPCTWNVGICYYRTIVNFYYKKYMLLKSYWIAVPNCANNSCNFICFE